MANVASALLVFNGFVVLLIGLLCGAPLGRAIVRQKREDDIRAWRVAHASLVAGGVMLLAIAAMLPGLGLSQNSSLAVSILLSISMYAFSFALVYGAHAGHRGLRAEGSIVANGIYYTNLAGVGTSLIAVAWLVYAAAAALLKSLLT